MNGFQLAGSELFACNLAKGLAALGHQCLVASVYDRGRFRENAEALKADLRVAGVETRVLGHSVSALGAILASWRLVKIIRIWRPDIVHVHADVPAFIVALSLRLTQFPVARTIHNPILWPTRWLAGYISERAFKDELVIHISAAVEGGYRDLRLRYGLTESAHQTSIPNAVPLVPRDIRADRQDLADLFGADLNKVLLCFVGRFAEQKGVDLLLDAIWRLPKKCSEQIQIHMFGFGRQFEQIKTESFRKALPLVFHGPVAGASRLMSAFDAVLMPSRFEGFPLVALEALGVGTPVIGTAAPGLNETYPPDWPLVVPVNDAAALASMIQRFIDGEFDRKRLAETAEQWVGKKFQMERMVRAYKDAYRTYLAEVGPTRPSQDHGDDGYHRTSARIDRTGT